MTTEELFVFCAVLAAIGYGVMAKCKNTRLFSWLAVPVLFLAIGAGFTGIAVVIRLLMRMAAW